MSSSSGCLRWESCSGWAECKPRILVCVRPKACAEAVGGRRRAWRCSGGTKEGVSRWHSGGVRAGRGAVDNPRDVQRARLQAGASMRRGSMDGIALCEVHRRVGERDVQSTRSSRVSVGVGVGVGVGRRAWVVGRSRPAGRGIWETPCTPISRGGELTGTPASEMSMSCSMRA